MANYDQELGPQRVGGGTITFRFVLSAVAAVTLYLIQAFGSHIVSQLDALNKTQSRTLSTIATLAQQGSDTSKLAQRDSDRIDDHEHRITILETRSSP